MRVVSVEVCRNEGSHMTVAGTTRNGTCTVPYAVCNTTSIQTKTLGANHITHAQSPTGRRGPSTARPTEAFLPFHP